MAKRRIRIAGPVTHKEPSGASADALKHSPFQLEVRTDSRAFQSNDVTRSQYPEPARVVGKDVHRSIDRDTGRKRQGRNRTPSNL